MSRLPAAFVTDMGPTPAFEDDAYARALGALGRSVKPKAVIVMSPHWLRRGGLAVTASARPETIRDFGGFPEEMYGLDYPCPGDPALAADVVRRLSRAGLGAEADARRGLDHAAWVPLSRLFPEADVPVLQLSAPAADPRLAAAAGAALAPLREEGALLLASGTLVHNLRLLRFGEKDAPEDGWAEGFDRWVASRLTRERREELYEYARAPAVERAVPTPEHFETLFFALGAAGTDRALALYRDCVYGSGVRRIVVFDRQ